MGKAHAEFQRGLADSSAAVARADAEASRREAEANAAARRAIQRAAEATRIAEVGGHITIVSCESSQLDGLSVQR